MKIKQGYMLRNVCGNYVVVPVGKASIEFRGLINLNEVAAFLWKELTTDKTKDELVERLLEEYDVSKEQAISDVNEFIKTIKEANFLEE